MSLIPIVDDLINLVEFKLGITERNPSKLGNNKEVNQDIDQKQSTHKTPPIVQHTPHTMLLKQKYHCLFDVAANLSHFSDVHRIIKKAQDVNVTRFFLAGYTLQSNYKNIELCNTYSNDLYCGIGIHPYNVTTHDLEQTMHTLSSILSQNTSNTNIKVIGESGLDYSDHFPDPKIQRIWFEKHIELALKLNMKLYLHERLAFKDTVQILKKYNFDPTRVLIHCFTGNEEELLQYLEMGYNISISGYLTKRKHGRMLRNMIHHIPLSKLMIESDAPYMYIDDKRVKKLKLLDDKSVNEPIVLPFILEHVHKCYGDKYSLQEIAQATTQNAIDFFDINP